MKKFLLSLVALLGVLNAQAAWEKVTTLAVGDVVVLAFDNETVSKELSEISLAGQNMIGKVEDYSGAPAGLYPLTVVAGSAENSLAFMNGSVYLSWSSGNTLTTSEEISDASSWTVEFDANGKAIISNVGTTARKLQYNTGSPRFACYTGTQQNAYLWKEVAGDAVAKPVLTASASFVESIEVTMSAAEGATIHFTQDGTEPTAESATYTEPLTITATTTVKAIAVVGEKSSAVAEATYTQLTKITLAEAQTAEAGTSVFVEGTVVASAASGAVIYDGTDYLYYYNNSNALTVGQKVRMIGTLASFGGANQMPNSAEVTVLDTEDVVYPAAVALDGAALDAIKTAGVVTRQYASMLGTLTISGNYFNVAVEGAAEAVGSIVKPNEDLAELNGETVKITGYVMYVNKKYVYFVATSVEKVKTTLDNAGFEVSDESNALGIRTYQKDIKDEEVAQMQEVTGWTIVENGDARAAGVFAYGSESFLGGEGFVAPAAQYAFEEGAAKALGIIAVWSASLQYIQEVYLAPGNYMLQVPVYNAGGTGAVASNLIGAAGTYASTTQYPVGQWSVSNVEFTVEAAQTVTFSLGYKAAGAGSGSMPHLFIESATLFSGDEAIATAKETADTRVAALNATIALDKAKATKLAALDAMVAGEGLFQCSQEAIDLAKRAVNAATTVEEVEAASPALTQPDAEKQYSFQLKDGGKYMAVNEGIKLADQAYPFSFVQVEGGWALKDGDAYVAMTGTGSNVWSMGTTADPYAWAVSALGDGYYTLAKASNNANYIGVDDTAAGSSCFADKGVSDKASWAIAEYVAPVVYNVTIAEGISNGTVEATPTEAEAGETVSLTAIPAEGYELESFMVTCKTIDEVVVVGEDHVFTMPADDVTVSATFKEKTAAQYTVTISDEIVNGTLVAEPATAEAGTKIQLTATPADGYLFESFKVTGDEVDEVIVVAEDGTFEMPAFNVTASATFKEESPKNITNKYLTNADLSVEDNGWSYYSDDYKYQGWRTANNDVVIPGVEFYAGWGSLEHTNFKFSQNVTLPAGDYRIVVNAFYREGNDGNGTNADKAWIFAGEKKQNVYGLNKGELNAYASAGDDMNKALAAFKDGKFENAFDFSLAEETAVDLGFEGKFDAIRQWCILGPVKLYQYSLEDYLVAYREKVAEAQAVDGKMGATEKAALENAIVDESTFTLGSQVAAAIETIDEAIAAAKLSIAGYAALAESLAKGEEYKAHSSDETAKGNYDAAVADVNAAYEAGTVVDLAVAKATVDEALPALARTQTADGSDLTVFIVNSTINGADGWTCERPKGGNGPLLNGTAFEYWAGNADPRSEGCFDYYQVIEGLPNGLYTISAEMYNSLNSEGGDYTEFAATSGVYGAAGGAEVSKLVDVDGTDLIKYTTETITVTDGTLRIGVKNVTTPMAARWFVADNFSLTLVKAISDDMVPYYAALNSIEDGESYRVFTEVGEKKFYLNTAGYLVADAKTAATFTFAKVNASGTLYETGINLGCKFTNPSLTNGSTGDIVKKGHIIVGTNNRNDWERQVFFLKDGKYAVRATNANSENWGANTYWTVDNVEAELPNAEYALTPSYVWQIEANVDNRPEAFEKAQKWAAKLQAIGGLVTDASHWTTNAQESSEGAIKNICDGDINTFFHSQWSGTGPDADHYIEATLPEAAQKFHIAFHKRNDNNRPTSISVSAGDAEPAQTITEGLPATAWYATEVDLGAASDVIRFTVTQTNTGGANNGHVYFTFGEFYILPCNELTDAASKYIVNAYTDLADEDVEAINNIDAQIEAAYQQVLLKEELADLKACVARAKEYVAAYPAADADELVRDATTTLNNLVNGEYTTKDEVANAKSSAILTVQLFVAAAGVPTADADITEWFVVNPTPTTNGDGWTITNASGAAAKANAYDPGNNVAEFWNQAAHTIAQTVTLPAGDYKLTAIALQRTDMTGYLFAGETQTTLADVVNTEVNSRTQANTWFNDGNGVNEVEFTMAETGEIGIGITTDKDNGDHWTVWRSFKIEKLAPAAPESVEYAGIIEQTVVNRQTGEQEGETTTDDQTITLIDAGEGLVDIKVNGGFTLPIGMKIPEFTIKGVTVVESQETASATYSYEGSVTIQNGMMTSTYDVTLTGYQASVEATPVFCVVLTQALIDTIYFGADQNAIDAYKTAVGIKDVKGAQNVGTIYDLSGRKVEKMVKGGIYIVNGKKVSFK